MVEDSGEVKPRTRLRQFDAIRHCLYIRRSLLQRAEEIANARGVSMNMVLVEGVKHWITRRDTRRQVTAM